MKSFVFLACALFAANSSAFDSFSAESARVTNEIKCPNPKITGGSGSWGALYGCVGGQAETVKFFINEEPATGHVKNVKFIWNDWTENGGYGLHADKALARSWASVLGTMYAPQHVDKVLKAFFGNSDITIKGESHILKYTHHSGPAADQRMIVVVEQ
ncbi:hypothetical protein [Marinobacter salsuginis]|uniref:hypothetical protein n=1 Tax=Marinobacter salsuginis TaxID=418719 RepID=UPI00273D12C0|nr:hypothetical protein [Marinobacter salsuginis]